MILFGSTTAVVTIFVTRLRGSDDRFISIATDAQMFSGLIINAVAIVFAFTFSRARYWPSVLQAVRLTYADTWVGLSVVAVLFSVGGHLLDHWVLLRLASALWLVSSLFGVLVLVRNVWLANTSSLNYRLSRVIARQIDRKGKVPRNFLNAIDEAIIDRNELLLRDYVDQLAKSTAQVRDADGLFAISNAARTLVKKLARASALNEIPWEIMAYSFERLLFSVLNRLMSLCQVESTDPRQADKSTANALQQIDANLQLIARCFDAWLVRGDLQSIDKQFINRPVQLKLLRTRQRVSLVFDPEPKVTVGGDAQMKLSINALYAVLLWRALTRSALPGSQDEIYAMVQFATGVRYQLNYWEGASIIKDCFQTLHKGGDFDDRQADNISNQIDLGLAESLLRCFYLCYQHDYDSSEPISVELKKMFISYIKISSSEDPAFDTEGLRSWLNERISTFYDYSHLGGGHSYVGIDLVYASLCAIQLLRAVNAGRKCFNQSWDWIVVENSAGSRNIIVRILWSVSINRLTDDDIVKLNKDLESQKTNYLRRDALYYSLQEGIETV